MRKGIPACCRPSPGGSTADPFKVSHYLLGDFVVAPVPDALPSLIVWRGDAPARRCGGLLE